jgi:hypothetical protein
MANYWAVVTVAGPTRADITIDGDYIPIGPSATGGLGGDRVIASVADPIPFVFHAAGVKGYPVTLGIVLSPLPNGSDIKFNPPAYQLPADGSVLTVNGSIPLKPAAAGVAVAPGLLTSQIKVGTAKDSAPPKKSASGKKKAAATKTGGKR